MHDRFGQSADLVLTDLLIEVVGVNVRRGMHRTDQIEIFALGTEVIPPDQVAVRACRFGARPTERRNDVSLDGQRKVGPHLSYQRLRPRPCGDQHTTA
jgi:hypothetical protein